MKKKSVIKLIFLICVVTLISIYFILNPITKDEQPSMLQINGFWVNPPMYNGGIYAIDGIGAASDFIFGKLAIYSPLERKFINYLAESIEEEENKLTVKIKDGIFWDNGEPFTSKDVKAQFVINDAWMNMWYVWKFVDSIDIPDDKTVIFNFKEKRSILVVNFILNETLKTPYSVFEKWMEPAEEIVQFRKDGKEGTEEYKQKYENFRKELRAYKPELPMGYGPFRVEKVGVSEMLLEKVERYPGIENVKVNKIKISKYPMIWTELKNGNLDIYSGPAPQDLLESIIKETPNITVTIGSDFAITSLLMNSLIPPFDDVRFRKALAYIIDRDKVRKVSSFYCNTIDKFTGIIPTVKEKWIIDEDFIDYSTNLNKAETLLQEMNYKRNKDGFWCDDKNNELSLFIKVRSDWADWILAADEIARQLVSFGIKTSVDTKEYSLYLENINNQKFQLAIDYSVISRQHPYEGFGMMYHAGYFYKFMNTEVKDENGNDINLTDLTRKLYFTFDEDKQKEIIQTLSWATNEYVPVIELFEKNSIYYTMDGSRITGWPTNQNLLNGLSTGCSMFAVKEMLNGNLKAL